MLINVCESTEFTRNPLESTRNLRSSWDTLFDMHSCLFARKEGQDVQDAVLSLSLSLSSLSLSLSPSLSPLSLSLSLSLSSLSLSRSCPYFFHKL